MVRWYQPLLLLRIGARALLATVIGGLADNRELQATDSRDQSNQWTFDTKDNELWVDFIADTGDGWESSFAIASTCLLYTSPSPRDLSTSRMPSSA